MADILTIIVSYNGMRWIERCLDSVRGSSMPSDIFVVDNGSVDGTREWLRSQHDLTYVESEHNLGFGAGNNIGLRHALEKGYQYVYLLNQDAWVLPDTFSRMVAAFEAGKSAGERFGILSPLQTTADGSSLDARFRHYYSSARPETASGVREMRFVMAAHWMIRRECLQEVGGFSPVFSQYGEDDNWLHRAEYFCWHCGVVPAASAVHDRDWREMPRDKRMRLKCVASVVKISDPCGFLPWRLVRQPLELLAISVRYCSAAVFRYLFTLVGRYGELVARRRESMRPGAFL